MGSIAQVTQVERLYAVQPTPVSTIKFLTVDTALPGEQPKRMKLKHSQGEKQGLWKHKQEFFEEDLTQDNFI